MNAPDKVYYTQTENVVNYFTTVKPFERECVDYIRKDALLELIKKEMKEWSSESNTAQGVKMGLALVIDKIESL